MEVTMESKIISNRPCYEVKLVKSGYSVFMAEYLSGGEDEDALEVLMGDNLINVNGDQAIKFKNSTAYQRKQVEFGIKKIMAADGTEIQFSIDWYRDLPKPDILVLKKFVVQHYNDSDEKKSTQQSREKTDTEVLHDGVGQNSDSE